MSVRVRYKVIVAISSTSAEEKDLANQTYEMVSDGLNEGGTMKVVVPASTTNLQIQLPVVAPALFVAIRTNSKDPTLSPVSLDFKRNGTSAEVFTVAPLPACKEGQWLMSTVGLNSLYVTNSGSVDMEVTLSISA